MTDPGNAFHKLEERIAEMERAAVSIREETRKAHEAIKELRQVQKETKAHFEQCHDLLVTEAASIVDAAIAATVEKGLTEYAKTLEEHMDLSVDKIHKEFRKLANAYLTGKATALPFSQVAKDEFNL